MPDESWIPVDSSMTFCFATEATQQLSYSVRKQLGCVICYVCNVPLVFHNHTLLFQAALSSRSEFSFWAGLPSRRVYQTALSVSKYKHLHPILFGQLAKCGALVSTRQDYEALGVEFSTKTTWGSSGVSVYERCSCGSSAGMGIVGSTCICLIKLHTFGFEWLCDFVNWSFSTKYCLVNVATRDDYASIQRVIALLGLENHDCLKI